MKARSLVLIAAGVVALAIFCPASCFVFSHLKEGYDTAERESATRPKPAPAPVQPEPDKSSGSAPDFDKTDFSQNTTEVNNRTDHFVNALPTLNGSGKNGYHTGMISQGRSLVTGGVQSLSGASWERLPSAGHSGGLMVVELAVQRGTLRAYVQGLDGSFVSGWVFVEATPGHPGRVIGYLDDQSDTGSPEQRFVLETRAGDAEGVTFSVYRKE